MIGNKLLLGSNNQDKLKELSRYFRENNIHIDLATPKDFGISEPEETEHTFEGNAKLKAKYYSDKTGLICLADDTGVCVHELDGQPGVYTADWAGPNKDFQIGIDRIQAELQRIGLDPNKATAKFVCVLALCFPDTKEFKTFRGEIEGHLNFELRNVPGFGFQPIFVPYGATKCYAMMSEEEQKHYGHHRINAFNEMIESCFSNSLL